MCRSLHARKDSGNMSRMMDTRVNTSFSDSKPVFLDATVSRSSQATNIDWIYLPGEGERVEDGRIKFSRTLGARWVVVDVSLWKRNRLIKRYSSSSISSSPEFERVSFYSRTTIVDGLLSRRAVEYWSLKMKKMETSRSVRCNMFSTPDAFQYTGNKFQFLLLNRQFLAAPALYMYMYLFERNEREEWEIVEVCMLYANRMKSQVALEHKNRRLLTLVRRWRPVLFLSESWDEIYFVVTFRE